MNSAIRKGAWVPGTAAPRPTNVKRAAGSSPFTEFETTVIEAWLGLATTAGPDLDTALRGLGVSKAPSSHSLDKADVAIAQLVLRTVRRRLPSSEVTQHTCIRPTDRALIRPWESNLALLPWHIVTVGWPGNGPARSNAEAYYLAWLPYYDRYVVTASWDTPDYWGYHDAALGDFRRTADPMRDLQCVISDWWNVQACRYRSAKWRYVFQPGLVSSETARAWARAVWPDEE